MNSLYLYVILIWTVHKGWGDRYLENDLIFQKALRKAIKH